jgi:hypothetical protein
VPARLIATFPRIFTGIRSKGITVAMQDPVDGRRHLIWISDHYFPVLQGSLQLIVDWCQVPENTLIDPVVVGS